MKKNKPDAKVGRRDFLFALGTGAGAAAAGSGPFVDQAIAANATKDEERKSRYQANSPNIQAYYRVIRYPTK
jgi:nitrous oxide reductase